MEEMQLTVAYKGTNHNVSVNPQATLADFQDILEERTNVPPSLQKLLYRGKKPFSGEADSVTVTDAGLKSGLKVTLMGSTNDELSSMQAAEKETRRREEIMRRRQVAGPSKVYSTSRPETKFKFHRIEPLLHLPKPEAARAVLEKLAADPAIKHVMTKHEFEVGVLTELAPHENPTLLGLNVNAGQSIKLRLRTDAYDGMRTYKEIRRVLCHELTHNVFGDHDDKFKTLNSQLNREVEEFETAVARGSRTLGGSISDVYEPDPSLSTSLMDSEAHSYVLGGGVGAGSALVPSREEMRRRAAEAALNRQRREEQEIEDRCGSDGPAALK